MSVNALDGGSIPPEVNVDYTLSGSCVIVSIQNPNEVMCAKTTDPIRSLDEVGKNIQQGVRSYRKIIPEWQV